MGRPRPDLEPDGGFLALIEGQLAAINADELARQRGHLRARRSRPALRLLPRRRRRGARQFQHRRYDHPNLTYDGSFGDRHRWLHRDPAGQAAFLRPRCHRGRARQRDRPRRLEPGDGSARVPTLPTGNVVARLTTTGTPVTSGDFSGDGITDIAILPAPVRRLRHHRLLQTGPPARSSPSEFQARARPSPLPATTTAPATTTSPPTCPPSATTPSRTRPARPLASTSSLASRAWARPSRSRRLLRHQPGRHRRLPDLARRVRHQDPTGKTPGEEVQFGQAGAGNSIPVPGDCAAAGAGRHRRLSAPIRRLGHRDPPERPTAR